MKVGIAIDAWKLSIFEWHLTAAHYLYVVGPGLSGSLVLQVETEAPKALERIVRAASAEAALRNALK